MVHSSWEITKRLESFSTRHKTGRKEVLGSGGLGGRAKEASTSQGVPPSLHHSLLPHCCLWAPDCFPASCPFLSLRSLIKAEGQPEAFLQSSAAWLDYIKSTYWYCPCSMISRTECDPQIYHLRAGCPWVSHISNGPQTLSSLCKAYLIL